MSFKGDDLVMVRLNPEWLPLGTVKKLVNRMIEPFSVVKRIEKNAYKLELTSDLGANSVFNVIDLTLFHDYSHKFITFPFDSPPIDSFGLVSDNEKSHS